jgi:5-(aminomethyl)-3-furanmethanol phosphate kinase
MTLRPVRVIKLGGSLFEFPDLLRVFLQWLEAQPPRVNVIVPGGGAAADAVREADRRTRLDPEEAHWLAVGAMSQMGNWLAGLLPEAKLVDSLEAITGALPQAPNGTNQLLIVDAEPLMRSAPAQFGPESLPYSWDVTSDSIAARLAEVLAADELVLLKSCLPGIDVHSWKEAAQSGYVDRHFPLVADRVRSIRTVNLRTA